MFKRRYPIDNGINRLSFSALDRAFRENTGPIAYKEIWSGIPSDNKWNPMWRAGAYIRECLEEALSGKT